MGKVIGDESRVCQILILRQFKILDASLKRRKVFLDALASLDFTLVSERVSES